MLAFDDVGAGAPLVLLHGTTSSRAVWDPILPALIAHRRVIRADLPCHGASAPTSFTPPDWAPEVVQLLDTLGLDQVPIAGHSAGGWTALEVAKLGRASAVLSLTPAGLWRQRSPRTTNAGLMLNWLLSRHAFGLSRRALRFGAVRAVALRQVSARGHEVPAEVAIAAARIAGTTDSFRRHFAQTRRTRFTGGDAIASTVPVRVVWGDVDHIAKASTSRHRDELPPHATVETWDRCGHMVMWDQPERVVAATLAISSQR
ncbi:MAG: alpha/beta fold hydrolase [Baekduia sp.]